MMLYGLLLFGCLAYFVDGKPCLFKALDCIRLYRSFGTHKGLLETGRELDRECRLQRRFFSCLRGVSPQCYTGRKLKLPEGLVSKEDALLLLCSKGDTFRERYLDHAPCINQQDTEYCTSKEYLRGDLEMESPLARRCTLKWKSEHCLADLLKDQCGDDASLLYKELISAFESDDGCDAWDQDYEHSDHDFYYKDESSFFRKYGHLTEYEENPEEQHELQRSEFLRQFMEEQDSETSTPEHSYERDEVLAYINPEYIRMARSDSETSTDSETRSMDGETSVTDTPTSSTEGLRFYASHG